MERGHLIRSEAGVPPAFVSYFQTHKEDLRALAAVIIPQVCYDHRQCANPYKTYTFERTIDMACARNRRYAMFALLYFSQGTILSYFTALNGLYFLDHGLSMTDVGIFATIALIPFVIKVFLGILSDRINLLGLGHRKPYILLGLTVQILCLIVAPFIDPGAAYWAFVAMAFLLQMGMALYDTCTDGLALDTATEEEKGTIQGLMVGGRALGVVITASFVGLLAEHVSWAAVFWLLAGFTLLPVPLVLGVRESPRPIERAFQWEAFAAFKQTAVVALAAMGFLFFLIIAGANQLVNPYLEARYNIGLSTAGFITTVWGIGVVLGGAAGGRLIDRIGDRQAVIAALGLSLLSILALAFVISPAMTWPLVALFGLSYGTYQTVYFALAMGHTDPRIAASMYSILMAVVNVAQGVGMGASGLMADTLGFRWTFVAIAAFNLLIIPLLPLAFGKRGSQPVRV
jgi:MFS transporter, PAT family, beta-lactamase induction signal transducer AmpG